MNKYDVHSKVQVHMPTLQWQHPFFCVEGGQWVRGNTDLFPILVTYFAAQWKTEEIHGKKFEHI